MGMLGKVGTVTEDTRDDLHDKWDKNYPNVKVDFGTHIQWVDPNKDIIRVIDFEGWICDECAGDACNKVYDTRHISQRGPSPFGGIKAENGGHLNAPRALLLLSAMLCA